jgi:hypothetical protein
MISTFRSVSLIVANELRLCSGSPLLLVLQVLTLSESLSVFSLSLFDIVVALVAESGLLFFESFFIVVAVLRLF